MMIAPQCDDIPHPFKRPCRRLDELPKGEAALGLDHGHVGDPSDVYFVDHPGAAEEALATLPGRTGLSRAIREKGQPAAVIVNPWIVSYRYDLNGTKVWLEHPCRGTDPRRAQMASCTIPYLIRFSDGTSAFAGLLNKAAGGRQARNVKAMRLLASRTACPLILVDPSLDLASARAPDTLAPPDLRERVHLVRDPLPSGPTVADLRWALHCPPSLALAVVFQLVQSGYLVVSSPEVANPAERNRSEE